jgi:hypothetical protein
MIFYHMNSMSLAFTSMLSESANCFAFTSSGVIGFIYIYPTRYVGECDKVNIYFKSLQT